MKLGYTILYVADVAKSLAFYGAAFGLKTRFLHESGDFGELATGETTLAFCSRRLLVELGKTPITPDPLAASSEIALLTDDVPAAYALALQAGARAIQAPERMSWGQTVAYVADQDGFLVELCTPVGC